MFVETVGESVGGGVGKLLLTEGVQLGQSNGNTVGNAVGKQIG